MTTTMLTGPSCPSRAAIIAFQNVGMSNS